MRFLRETASRKDTHRVDAKVADAVQASAASIPFPLKELVTALAAPAESERIVKSWFSSSYATGYPGQNWFRPESATATFDIGRFGDLPARQ